MLSQAARRPRCFNAPAAEDLAGRVQKGQAFEQGVGQKRQEGVEFELAGHGRRGHKPVQGHDPKRGLAHGLADDRVDLSGHDARPGLDLGEHKLPQPGPGTRGQRTQVPWIT